MANEISRFIIAGLLLLILSNILQTVSLAAPGWLVYNQNLSETRFGTFYKVICEKEFTSNGMECETKSWPDLYKEDLEKIRLKTLIYINSRGQEYDYAHKAQEYHLHVREQVLFVLVLVLTLACLVIQISKCTRSHGIRRPLVKLLSSSAMATACGLMLSQLSFYYIDHRRFLAVEPETIRLPYCVLLYTMSALVNLVTFVMYVIEYSQSENSQMSEANDIGMITLHR